MTVLRPESVAHRDADYERLIRVPCAATWLLLKAGIRALEIGSSPFHGPAITSFDSTMGAGQPAYVSIAAMFGHVRFCMICRM